MNIELVPHQLLYFGAMLLCAYFMGKLFLHLGLGEVTGQLLGGLLVSPYLWSRLNFISVDFINAFDSLRFFIFLFLGLVAFGLGEELHYDRIKEVGLKSYIICFMQAIFTFVLVSIAFLFLGFSPLIALIIGSIGVATAPAALFILMNKMTIEGELRSKLANIVVLDDVLEIIIFSTLVQIALFVGKGEKIIFGKAVIALSWEILFSLLIGFGIFIFLKLFVKEIKLETTPAPSQEATGLGFLRFVFHDRPSPSVEIFVVLAGIIVFSSALAWEFHLPFLLTITFSGFLIANYHSRRIFDSLFIGNITPFINLIFFGLIGSSVNLATFNFATIKFVGIYILMRSIGKIGGTWLGCKMTHQDIKLANVLPLLMLPQAGVSAVEVAFVSIVLPQGSQILQIIIPAILIFEIGGIFLSEQVLQLWKSWVIGEADAISRRIPLGKYSLLASLLEEEDINFPFMAENKAEAISGLLEILVKRGKIKQSDHKAILQEFLYREKIQSTGIGDNIAIPHIRSDKVNELVCAMGIIPDKGIDFSAIDSKEVNIIFLFISPADDSSIHLKLLSEIAFICRNPKNRDIIKSLSSKKDIVNFFKNFKIG
jgi:mannitol/fructose-specific phosphotransferase system IIA component (Ntr-type)